MKEKHRLIPVLIFAFILTVLCTAAVSRWYLLHQKGGTYNSILLGKLVSSDGRKLVLQGNITNPQGRNGQYAITYSPGITAADKTKDSHITPPTAIPQLLVTYGPDKTEIPSFSGGYQLYTPDDEGTAEAVIACGAEPLSYLVGKVPDIPYVKLGDRYFPGFQGRHCPRFGHGSGPHTPRRRLPEIHGTGHRGIHPGLFRQRGLFYPGYQQRGFTEF